MTDRFKIFLFPPFTLKYVGNETDIIHDSGIPYNKILEKVSIVSNTDLTDFNIDGNNFVNNELKNQLITFTISCIFSNILESRSVISNLATGLSMGLYAALYNAKCIRLEDGVLLIKRVHQHLLQITAGKKYAMLNIIGLNITDVSLLIKENQLKCEIVIKNGHVSFIISGEANDIHTLQSIAQEEGALFTNIFPSTIPYHSSYIQAIHSFKNEIIYGIDFKKPSCGLFSPVSGRSISSVNQIKREIIHNLILPVDWMNAMIELNKYHNNIFFECGSGNSLTKISKTIDRNIHICHISEVL